MVELDGLLPHADSQGVHLQGPGLRRALLVLQLLQPVQPCFLLGGAGPAAPLRPLQLHAKEAPALPLGGKLHLLPFRLKAQEPGIVPLIAVELPPVQLQDPVCDPVQEISVVGHHDEDSLELP